MSADSGKNCTAATKCTRNVFKRGTADPEGTFIVLHAHNHARQQTAYDKKTWENYKRTYFSLYS